MDEPSGRVTAVLADLDLDDDDEHDQADTASTPAATQPTLETTP